MKEKFLKDLEKKLSVLSDEEIKDIINEYSDIIDEKIKHGKTEEESIKEFGDIKELSKEILKTYKINPDYNKSEFSEKTNDFIKSGEDLIKKGAQKLSDVTEDVVDSFKNSGTNFDTANVFEIIIKVIIVLVCLALLRIPFYIIGEFGEGIFRIDYLPFNGLIIVLWKILIFIVYIIVCVLLVMSVVSKYTNKNTTKQVIKEKNDNTKNQSNIKSENNKKNNTDKTETKNESIKKENIKKVKPKDDTFGNFLIVLIKIWCVILILVPLWCMEIGFLCAICVTIYLIIKGIEIYGILLLLIGVFGMIGYFADLVWKLLFNKGKIHIFPVFINMVLIIVGGLLTFDYITSIHYINKLPSEYKEVTSTYVVTIDETTHIDDYIDKYIDNTLADNQLKFEVTYYNDIYEISEPRVIDLVGDDRIRTIYHFNHQEFRFDNKYFKEAIDNLKDKKIYNYSLMDHVSIRVYSNEATSKLYD